MLAPNHPHAESDSATPPIPSGGFALFQKQTTTRAMLDEDHEPFPAPLLSIFHLAFLFVEFYLRTVVLQL
jgi:hypothetical protein